MFLIHLNSHTYKYNEDLFRKVSIVPDGKNHGLIFIFDWSGSMQDYLLDTYKQLCSLVWFCKKVSIPFEVYSFQSEVSAYAQYDPSPEPIYTKKKSAIAPDVGFRLVNILTSKVNSRVLDHQMNTLLEFVILIRVGDIIFLIICVFLGLLLVKHSFQ